MLVTCYLPYRSLQYRHGPDVMEEQVEEVEIKSEPWQLSEEVLEDFYDGLKMTLRKTLLM